MGKPFQSELGLLADTYAWAMACPVGDLASKIQPYRGLPLVCVGSGGSLTTAHLAAALHLEFAGRVSRAMTPLEAASAPVDWKAAGAMLFTAGGGNPDVLGCFRHLAARDMARLGVVCCRAGGRILGEAGRHPAVVQFLIAPPSHKDGFLATNTLLASAVVLSRAFAEAAGRPVPLPATLDGYFAEGTAAGHLAAAREAYHTLLGRDTLVVLHGPATQPAAADIESKFVEAALGNVQLADYRNFAHGRHHWLAKRADSTGVLAIVCDADRALAEQTLGLLPGRACVVRMDVAGTGPAAALGATVRGFYLTAAAGERRGIDPGDPGVPAFGRRLYHLDAYPARRAAGAAGCPGPLSFTPPPAVPSPQAPTPSANRTGAASPTSSLPAGCRSGPTPPPPAPQPPPRPRRSRG